MSQSTRRLPTTGRTRTDILEEMDALRQKDIHWKQGKAFSLVFYPGDEANEISKEAYTMFFSENGLNPTAFPSLRRFETEVVAMAAGLLNGDENTVGNMTSGGTESLLMALKTARDWGRVHKPEVRLPEVILPVSGHPASEKSAHYLGMKVVHVPVGEDLRADVEAVRRAITANTVLIVGSAPSYPHGVIDPIAMMAEIAQANGVLMHVDAAVGGFMLPFVRKLGYPVPDFDFAVPGVTSISADLHKYGYAAKGASVILYREKSLRRHQYFVYADWPGGVYASPTMAGTRPGGAIAAAWAVMNYLGEAGYLSIAGTVMKTTQQIREGIASIPGLQVLSNPEMSILAIASNRLNIYEVGDEMTLRGWHLDRQQFPASLHMTINYAHRDIAEQFLSDLEASARAAGRLTWGKLANNAIVKIANAIIGLLPEKTATRLTQRSSRLLTGGNSSALPDRTAAIYGLIGSLPNRGDVNDLVLDLIDSMTR